MKNKQIKIGILGEIRAGKDTVAELIVHTIKKESYNKHTEKFALSSGIYSVLKLTMPQVLENGKPREALQVVGQALRQLEPDVWIDYLFNHHFYRLADRENFNLLITDVRQPNEVARLQEQGYKIIKVTASPEVRLQRAKDSGDDFDESMFSHDTELLVHACKYDYLIDNSYSIDALEESVLSIMRMVLADE